MADKEMRRNREFKRKYFINDLLVCENLLIRTFYVSSAQINQLVKKRQQGAGLMESIDDHGKPFNYKKNSNEVKEDLKISISKIPKYSGHYSREKDTTDMLTVVPGVTKQAPYGEFLRDKNYKISKDWAENIRLKVYKNHFDTCNTYRLLRLLLKLIKQ